ncbi:MAG: TfoX/Sxy family protein [Rhizobiaceae bacterium]|nr:TfoX/Sxy family protein [Rhizobiaceae bacterium]
MSAELADRIRAVVNEHPNTGEIRMFGGLCFTLNGNMLVGTMKNGDLMVRVGEEQDAAAHARPGAGPMMFTGKAMKGFVTVDADAIDTEDALREWISMAMAYVGPMPPKKKKARKDS